MSFNLVCGVLPKSTKPNRSMPLNAMLSVAHLLNINAKALWQGKVYRPLTLWLLRGVWIGAGVGDDAGMRPG